MAGVAADQLLPLGPGRLAREPEMTATAALPATLATAKATVNLHIVRNPVSHDSRVLKETATLRELDLFAAVEIAGFHEPGYAEHEDLDGRHLWRVVLSSRGLPKNLLSQAVKFAEWRHRLVGHYRDWPLGVIHCHDLEPLPIAVYLKRLTGAALIYDAHELETERTGLRGLRQELARLTEQQCMKWVDAMITVSPSIRDWYLEKYPAMPIALVRNVPERPQEKVKPVNLRHKLGVPDGALLFIFLGGLGLGRGIENMLAAFSGPCVKHHLLVMGSGFLLGKVEAASASCRRIHYLPPVPPAQVLAHAAGADVGISLIEDTSLSYRYCLPNKLFESVLSGLPVLVSDLPDQSAFVNEYQAGWVTSPYTAAVMDKLMFIDRAEWARVRDGLARRSRELGWHNEAAELLGLYGAVCQPQHISGTVS